jgi:electron transfer flavoprotein alpha subunit
MNKKNTTKIDKDKWKDILVYVEHHKGNIHPITYELIGKALQLSKKNNYKVYCLFIGSNISKSAKKLSHYDIEKVFVYDHEEFKDYRADLYAKVFYHCIENVKPSVILIGGTDIGKSIAPTIATEFHTGLTADCTELILKENSDLLQIRPAFGGNIMAEIITPNHRPQFATVRYKVMDTADKSSYSKDNIVFCSIEKKLMSSNINVLEERRIDSEESITEANVLVVAGQGFKRKEDLWMVEDLAKRLNGKTACSRALVERGFMPYQKQIGLSGKTVKPNLMITCGVSGSVQFMAGMKGSKTIIAINNDYDAPIFNIAHQPICGDLYEIIPNLIAQLNKE